MANSFYDVGEQRPIKVKALFSKIARRYDLINDLQSFGLHRYWKRKVIELARVRSGAQALDLCCGTGDLALRLARQGARVVALDFAAPMLEIARQRSLQDLDGKTSPSGLPPISLTLVQADAHQIPFPENSFEIVTVGYGLRNLGSWEKGLQEMTRVAAPGARLVVLEFGKPKNRLWRALYFAYLKLFVPLLGYVFCGDAKAYAYILESLIHYPAPNEVAAKMQELGCEKARVIEFLGGIMSINYAEKKH